MIDDGVCACVCVFVICSLSDATLPEGEVSVRSMVPLRERLGGTCL